MYRFGVREGVDVFLCTLFLLSLGLSQRYFAKIFPVRPFVAVFSPRLFRRCFSRAPFRRVFFTRSAAASFPFALWWGFFPLDLRHRLFPCV